MVVIGTLPFYRSIGYDAWFSDEYFAVVRNADAHGTSFTNILRDDYWGNNMFDDTQWTHKSYRPVTVLSFALQSLISGGPNPHHLRAANCLLHTSNSLLLFRLLSIFGLPPKLSTLAALLFALHPVHAENIVYVVGRADSLASFFILLAVIGYCRMYKSTWGEGKSNETLPPPPDKPEEDVTNGAASPRGVDIRSFGCWIWMTLVMTVLAGLSKETGFLLPLLLLVYEILLPSVSRWRCAGLIVVFVSLCWWRSFLVGGTEVGFSYQDTPIVYQDSRLCRTLSFLNLHSKYAGLLIAPHVQSWDYSYNAVPMVRSPGDIRLCASLAVYLGLGAIGWIGVALLVPTIGRRLRRSDGEAKIGDDGDDAADRLGRGILVGLAFLVIPFLPASNLFFTVGTVIGERLLYPSSIGWSILIAHLGCWATSARRSRASFIRVLFWAVGVGFTAFYVYRVFLRVDQWKSMTSLYTADAHSVPTSAKALHMYGHALQMQGNLQEALDTYRKSLMIFDDNAVTDYKIAEILIEFGEYEAALERHQKIFSGNMIGIAAFNEWMILTDFGFLLARAGFHDRALPFLQAAVEANPRSQRAWNSLGYASWKLGKYDEAIDQLINGLELNLQEWKIWYNLHVVAADVGNEERASECREKAVKYSAGSPNNRYKEVLLSRDPIFVMF